MRPVLVALLVVLVPLAGCFSDDGEPVTRATGVAGSAEEAGAANGPAPAAARDPYAVGDASTASAVTVYPLAFETNPAKEPVTREFTGEFNAAGCGPQGGLPLGGLGLGESFQVFHFADALEEGDVFVYDVTVRWTNADGSWGEIHPFVAVGTASEQWQEPTGDARGEVVVNFTGQQYRVSDEHPAVVGVVCWYGAVTTPLAFTVTVTLHFAESGVPTQTPVLASVPEGATRLRVAPLALDPTRGVLSHFRVFDPGDALLCECALSSNEKGSWVDLPGPGDYVILVDHTENGFVSFALDAPADAPLRALDHEWRVHVLASGDGGAVDQTVELDLPTTPLNVGAWVWPAGFSQGGSPAWSGAGKDYSLTLTGPRGDVVRQKMGGFVTFAAQVPGAFGTFEWYPVPFPDGEWEFFTDHHAFSPGAHAARVEASALRAEATLFTMHYVR